MTVFFLRHATRDPVFGDPPLNKLGLEQASQLSESQKLQKVKTLLSSPKKRAQMTVVPLSQRLNSPIQQIDELDQHGPDETPAEFHARVSSVLDQLKSSRDDSPILLCSHSDWINVACQIIPSDDPDLRHHFFACAEFMEFQIEDGLWLRKS